jgi:energy-coupling factor transporter transmembrane protein EcfT
MPIRRRAFFSWPVQPKFVSSNLLFDPRVITALLSFLLSIWAVYTQDAINNDGIVYVGAAERLLRDDWTGAYALYNWPFYPWLIAKVSESFNNLGLEASAQLLDAAFTALLATTFVSFIQELGGDRKTQFIAAFVILFQPYLNEFRAEIFRDHGYWAFYLLAVLFFVRFFRHPNWGSGFVWGFTMVLASLFRIEGVVLLLLLPSIIWLRPEISLKARSKQFLLAHSVTLLMGLGLLIWVALDSNFRDLAGRLYEPLPRFTWTDIGSAFTSRLESQADRLASAILNRYSEEYALSAVMMILLVIIVDQLIKTLSPLYTLLPLLPGLRSYFQPPSGLRMLFVWLALLNFVIVFAFAVHFFFLASRHIVPLMLIALLVIPFILTGIHNRWQLRHQNPLSRPWLVGVLVAVLVYMSLDGLVSVGGASKVYIRDAGHWLADHVPTQARLYTNDRKLVYYSGRPIDWRQRPTWPIIEPLLERRFWENYDYLALAMSRKTPHISAQLNKSLGPPVAIFKNRKKDSVLIYQVRDI